MKSIFEYPYDSAYIMKKQKSLRKELLSDGTARIKKKIAVLTGSTADAVRDVLEVFLLNYGIEPEFYTSEYGQYYNEALFPSDELLAFAPDLVYIHTTYRNIEIFPAVSDSDDDVRAKSDEVFGRFYAAWESIKEKLGCPVIQNNFELPPFRLLGNCDASDARGRVNFISRLNFLFAEHAGRNSGLYINDINYVSSCFGLDEWYDNVRWYMYKYAMSMKAVPYLAANLAAIIKAIYGRNKKVLSLDLDNTLWGGVVGDDGPENLKMGKDLPGGQVFSDFQEYVKLHKDIGVLLTVCSKNDEQNALAGLKHPDCVIKPEDLTLLKANWENKDINIKNTASALDLLPESFVFADDNPAEREIVRVSTGAAVPEIGSPEDYIRVLDRNRYFEVTRLSDDDLRRVDMYRAKAQRAQSESGYADYGEYLDSLEMTAEIDSFIPTYYQRIAQLSNKSNQFNVTTRRYTEQEIISAATDGEHITVYGRLKDKFGDDGVVSAVIGEIRGDELHIQLWIMSCRVLKREMELAMLDVLAAKAKEKNIKKILGYYYPTAKNSMVKDLFGSFGFEKEMEDKDGNTLWLLRTEDYESRTKHIKIVSVAAGNNKS